MVNFLEYLKEENIIENTIELYSLSLKENSEIKFLNKILEYLFKKSKINYDSGLDIFGSIYQRNLSHKEKKILGEFYTPPSVVNYILDTIGYKNVYGIENKKLIDLSCGSGSFIIQAIKRLVYRHMRLLNYEDLSNLAPKEANNVVLNIKEKIYGIDINPIACILCQLNIHYVLFELLEIIKKFNENYILPKFNIRNIDSMDLKDYEHYDFIVGNPPYLFIRDIPIEQRKLIEARNLKTNKGQYDYYQIFLELGINFLKNGGKLGYIVPDSLLALSYRSIIREYIFNTTKINEIYHTGPKFNVPVVSNIILSLEKEYDLSKREKNLVKIRLLNQQEKQIPQKTIKKWNFKFLVYLNEADIPILEYLNENFPKLKDLSKFKGFKIGLSRGAELAKTGEIVYCEECQTYFPVPKKFFLCPECKSDLKLANKEKIIYSEIPKDKDGNYKKFLFSINRYQIKENKFIDISKKGINYKNLDIYYDRIVIRQLSQNSMICAVYDQDFSINSQSFYNLKIVHSPLEEFNHYYLLGIINSQLLSYYFFKSFGSYKKLFPRILIEKIKQLPIKIPETKEEREIAKEITDKVQILLTTYDMNIQHEVDSLIFQIYNINKKNREHISSILKS
ncbi:MAG: Eco57I restriction-modification methylase domain-containing protein [Promethearchaeota archaeon]